MCDRTMLRLPARVAELKGITYLGLIESKTKSLGDELPPNLCDFMCNMNEIMVLPDLPPNLRWLNVSHNKLIALPRLPDKLEILGCDDNQLIKLPDLPAGLRNLNCANNKLVKLPVLPERMHTLTCHGQMTNVNDNPFLHVPIDIAKKFNIQSHAKL